MLQSIRNLITTQLYIIKSTTSPWLLRHFSAISPLARIDSKFYPDDATRKLRYKVQVACHRARYQNDPLFRAAVMKHRRERWAAKKHDERALFIPRFRDWVNRLDWVRRDLPWKTYAPVKYNDKVEHFCHGCDWTRHGGMQLWWRRRRRAGEASDKHVADSGASEHLGKSDEFLCHGCYVKKHSISEALPEGYEDVRLLKDIVARKKQLGELAATSSNTSNSSGNAGAHGTE